MSLKKLLVASALVSASALNVNTYLGAGASFGVTTMFEMDTDKALENGDIISKSNKHFEVDGTKYKSKDDDTGFYLGRGFVTVAFLMDDLAPSMSLGFILDLGYQFTTGMDEKWGSTDTDAANPASYNFSVKPDFNSIFATPKLAIGFDISMCHLLFTLGLDMSRYSVEIESSSVADKRKVLEMKKMMFGIAGGLEAIFQVAPCVGVGAGVNFTYYPESWASPYGSTDDSADETVQALNPNLNKDDYALKMSTGLVSGKLALYVSL